MFERIDLPKRVRDYWCRFLETQPNADLANELFYDSFSIGYDAQDAEIGAQQILSGEKTATSALLWEMEEEKMPLPEVGSLSIVEDGNREPRCVIETTWVDVIPFGQVNAEFARDYGETDGTLEAWRRLMNECYSEDCIELGREFTEETPLVCERFRVVF